jgi:membrane-associated phospholipid phosphatase
MMTRGAKVLCAVAVFFVSLGFGVDAYSQSPAGQDSASTTQTATDGKVNEQANEAKPKPDAVNNPPARAEDHDNALGKPLLRHFVFDQKAIWTSPAHARFADAVWLVPFGGFTAALLASDRDFSKHLSNSPQTLSRYKKVSDYGIGAMVAAGGGMYLWGKMTSNDHARETGLLAGEAGLDSLAVTYAVKYATRRERPQQGNGNGNFWSGGDSFPSEHASAAWSIATVFANEYPGFLSKFFAYGGATAISLSRIKAKQHFPSDVLVGSGIGWLIGQYVYRTHHDPLAGGGGWETLSDKFSGEWARQPKNMGSPYVPLDSWIYPAFDRLAAMGYLESDIKGMRPWTRLECARLLGEAEDRLGEAASGASEAGRLYEALATEFASDLNLLSGGTNRSLRLDSVYTRITGISGQPLTDGYHFGQTIVNDFGRPNQEGVNNLTGFSGWATEGPFVAYVKGEYQHAPSAPALPLAARQFISSVDTVPLPPGTPVSPVNQFDLLDSYVGLTLENWQITYGKQSLWWGPMKSGPFLFSDNAEPVRMLRFSRVAPFRLPWIFRLLGEVRVEGFLGQLEGQEFVFGASTGLHGQFGQPLNPQPMIQGQKFSFKPTPNFEISISRTALFAGQGVPFTWHKLFQSTFSFGYGGPGSSTDSGDRRDAMDFTYRIPKLRDWVTFYGDAFTEDEFAPIAYPRKSAIQGGIYLARIPGIPKLDFRAEGGFTSPADFPDCVGCFYVNNRYISGYTNNSQVMGSWLGRASQGEQVWTTYWLSPLNTVSLSSRHQKVDGQYLPQGGTLNDVVAQTKFRIASQWEVSGSVGFEQWKYPVIAATAQNSVTASVQVKFLPRLEKVRQ